MTYLVPVKPCCREVLAGEYCDCAELAAQIDRAPVLRLDGAVLLAVRVPGTPRPKGSLRFVTRTYAREQVAGSPDWRAAVVHAAHEAIRAGCHDGPAGACTHLAPGFPHEGPVRVAIALDFTPPKKRPPLPTSVRSGDVDKHARNILDALQDAGVVRNDAQVVDLTVRKRYTDGAAGAVITVWAVALAAAGEPGTRGRDVWTPSPGAGATRSVP